METIARDSAERWGLAKRELLNDDRLATSHNPRGRGWIDKPKQTERWRGCILFDVVPDIGGDIHTSRFSVAGWRFALRGRLLDGFTVLVTGFTGFRPRGITNAERCQPESSRWEEEST